MSERDAGRMSADRVPLQSGVGSVANAVLEGLADSDFEHLSFYSEVMQDAVLTLLDSGKADFCSATSLSLSGDALSGLLARLDEYKGKIVLRDSEVSNNPEVIRRLGVIAMNTAVEADIYGNVNSSHMMGTKIYNGIGGSGDYARGASVSIFMTASTAKDGKISSIVPCVTHVDHTEHDVDVIVTEQGLADLRGLSPKERALCIIRNCSHPDYRALLLDYFDRACTECGEVQTPMLLDECFSFHRRFRETGSMLQEAAAEGE
jgi:Acetyl-CoA hydrolase